jgi:hypothetical protein
LFNHLKALKLVALSLMRINGLQRFQKLLIGFDFHVCKQLLVTQTDIVSRSSINLVLGLSESARHEEDELMLDSSITSALKDYVITWNHFANLKTKSSSLNDLEFVSQAFRVSSLASLLVWREKLSNKKVNDSSLSTLFE